MENMAKVTSLEAGLKRLLGLRPNIVLHPKDIQLIIDGKINEVLNKTSRYKLKIEPKEDTSINPLTTGLGYTDTSVATNTMIFTNDSTDTTKDDKSFGEYFDNN